MTESPERKLSAAETVRVELEREISDGILVPGDVLDEERLLRDSAYPAHPCEKRCFTCQC